MPKDQNHTGTVWLSKLKMPDTIFSFSLAQITFYSYRNILIFVMEDEKKAAATAVKQWLQKIGIINSVH